MTRFRTRVAYWNSTVDGERAGLTLHLDSAEYVGVWPRLDFATAWVDDSWGQAMIKVLDSKWGTVHRVRPMRRLGAVRPERDSDGVWWWVRP